MTDYATFQECRSYVAAHLHAKLHPDRPVNKKLPAVTISRQTGARGRTIGLKLQNALRAKNPKAEIPWTLFDDNLVEKILEDHDLPADLEKFMPDDALGELESSINEILGRHPSLWSLHEKTVDTIVRLCRMGHSIVVGRGGNLITGGFPNVLSVRLIGSEKHRIRQMTEVHGMSLEGAKDFIKKEDAARARYVKKHYSADIDDPMLYNLVISTDQLSDDAIVAMLVTAIETY